MAGQYVVSGTGINTVDSLLLTPEKIISFRGTFNINNYLELNGNTCDAFSEVSGGSGVGQFELCSRRSSGYEQYDPYRTESIWATIRHLL